MAFYSVRSERQFCERLRYDLLFKWFLNLNLDDDVWDQSTFAKNRERLLEHDVARRFFNAILGTAKKQHLLSRDHFTVDGPLLEAQASLKSLTPKPNLGGQRKPRRRGGKGCGGRNPEVDWRREKRSNQTHFSTTGPRGPPRAQGQPPRGQLSFAGHVVMENRSGLVVDVDLTEANGYAEREAGLRMLGGSAAASAVARWPETKASTPKTSWTALGSSAIRNTWPRTSTSSAAATSTSRPGYAVSQRLRKRVEEIFGCWKTVGGGRKLRFIGLRRNRFWAELMSSAYNLVRMGNLAVAAT